MAKTVSHINFQCDFDVEGRLIMSPLRGFLHILFTLLKLEPCHPFGIKKKFAKKSRRDEMIIDEMIINMIIN